jgi:hypothetical protein
VIYYESETSCSCKIIAEQFSIDPRRFHTHGCIEDLTFETTEIADSCPFSSKLVSLDAACAFAEKINLSSDPSFL